MRTDRPTDRQTDRPTDRQTDIVTYRAAIAAKDIRNSTSKFTMGIDNFLCAIAIDNFYMNYYY